MAKYVSGIKLGDLIKNIFSTLMVDFSDSSQISGVFFTLILTQGNCATQALPVK